MSRLSFVVLCLIVFSLVASFSCATVPEDVVPLPLSQKGGVWRPEKSVTEWTTEDVVLWLNYTIGYSEYAPFARKHRVDGLTLLAMDAADFENFFPIENGLHAIKMSAHLMYLQGKCQCTTEEASSSASGQRITSFIGYMRAHPVRTWVEGSLTLYFPRVSMLATYLFDKPMYRAVVNGGASAEGLSLADITDMRDDADRLKAATTSSVSRTPGWSRTLVYWVSFLIAPDLYMAYMCGTHLSFSYLYMGFFAVHFVFQAFNEYVVLLMVYRGTAFEANTTWLQRIWQLFSYTLLIPVASPIVALIVPSFLQVLLVWALMANTLLMIVGLSILLIGGEYNNLFFGGGSRASAEQAGTTEPTAETREETPAHGESKTEKID